MNIEEIQQRVSFDLQDALKDTATKEDIAKIKEEVSKELESITSARELIKIIAFAKQDQYKNSLEQANLGYEYSQFKSDTKKIEYLEADKKTDYYKELSEIKQKIVSNYIDIIRKSIIIEQSHKKIEQILNIDPYELGQNPEMSVYLATLISKEEWRCSDLK